MNDGDNHEDETASMHLVFLPLDTLTLPFQIYVHLTPMMMLQVFPPSMPVDKGIYLIPRKQLCVRLNKYGHIRTRSLCTCTSSSRRHIEECVGQVIYIT